MSKIQVRQADESDVPTLVALMTEFYGEAGFPLATVSATHAFTGLLRNPALGAVWLLEFDRQPAGHIVLTLSYSMEYGGLRGFIDDLFVRSQYRGRGLAAAGLSELKRFCSERDVCALHVEVGPENDVAQRVYRRSGFNDSEHLLLTLPLAPPVHESQQFDG